MTINWDLLKNYHPLSHEEVAEIYSNNERILSAVDMEAKPLSVEQSDREVSE